MTEDPIEITLIVIEVLEKLAIRYLVGGSLASSVYGEPRSTRDADLLADIKRAQVDELVGLLEIDFNISREAILDALLRRSSFNLIHYESLFKVDVFIPKNREFEEFEFERRKLLTVRQSPEASMYFASVEDIVLAKLDWFRQGDHVSEQQWRDLTGIFKANEDRLDLEYLKKTAKLLRVDDLLNRLI